MNRRNFLSLLALISISASASTFTRFETSATGTIGDMRSSTLTEAQFQSATGAGWVLADGRDVTGSAYHSLTGNTTIPDSRGRALRGKDHGTGVNGGGDLALGANQEDQLQSFQVGDGVYQVQTRNSYAGAGIGGAGGVYSSGIGGNSSSVGPFHENSPNGTPRIGNETRMDNTTVNFFIKIN